MIDEHLGPVAALFENRPLPALPLADLARCIGGSREAAGQGGSAIWPDGLEVVPSPALPVLSYLMGLQGRLDLR